MKLACAPWESPVTVATLIAEAIGVVSVQWHIVPDGNQLNFFGLTVAPGTSFTILPQIPEPTSAALLGLGVGLLGLAARRRRG